MTKATVGFVYFVGTLQTGFALRDFYTLFGILEINDGLPSYDETSWNNLRAFGFMWITIPLSGASGTLVFHLHYLTFNPMRQLSPFLSYSTRVEFMYYRERN
jgi:hypothetical protein